MKRTILVATTSLLLAACGSDRSGSYETEDGETVDYSVDASSGESSIDIKSEDGDMQIRSGSNVAVDLPDGFSLYPGAEVVTNSTINRNDGQGSMIIFKTDDGLDDVLAFYRKQAEAAGVKIEMEMKTAQGTMLAGKGDGDLIFSINANAQDGGTTGQMTVGRGLE